MFELRLDFRAFQLKARELGAARDQVSYALSNALNSAAFRTRESLISDTWPRHVQVRDRNFMRAALRIEKASKRDLTVAIISGKTDAGRRAHLALHAKGGTKQARRVLALPDRKILARRGAKGMPQALRPAALPNAFRQGDVLYQRTGRYTKGSKGKRGFDGRGLRLTYTFKPSARIKADVPFVEDFRAVMSNEVNRQFPEAIAKAMKTRR